MGHGKGHALSWGLQWQSAFLVLGCVLRDYKRSHYIGWEGEEI